MIKKWKKANKDNNQIKETIIEYLKCLAEINDKNEDIEDIKEEMISINVKGKETIKR